MTSGFRNSYDFSGEEEYGHEVQPSDFMMDEVLDSTEHHDEPPVISNDDEELYTYQRKRNADSFHWKRSILCLLILVGISTGITIAILGKQTSKTNTSSTSIGGSTSFGENKEGGVTTGHSYSGATTYTDSTYASSSSSEVDSAFEATHYANDENNHNHNNNDQQPDEQLLALLRAHSPSSGASALGNTDSYQYKAFQWVQSTLDPETHSIQRTLQRYALACIYYATYAVKTKWTDKQFGTETKTIPGWITTTGWLEYNTNECAWYRIQCNEDGWVTNIELFSNRLTGTFPPEVVLLKDTLEVIDIYNNYVYNVGAAGNDFLGELTQLRKLYYASTSFQYDGIPPAIGKLTNLVEYDCSFTLYYGDLRGEIFQNLHNLEYLYIGGNSFNSSIPIEIAQLQKLQYFYAEYTDITGDLSILGKYPDAFPSIIEIWIDRNPQLMGSTIPTEISSLSNLRSLSLTGCNLVGTIPTELGLLQLEQVWLYSNQLSGTIPMELGALERLRHFGVEDNPKLYGTMPSEICYNKEPMGLLEKLEADCNENEQVTCSCCTCCGAACVGSA